MNSIFNIQTTKEFLEACLQTFKYQYANILCYKQFVDYLKINPNEVQSIEKIPFLPIEMFKNHKILDQKMDTDFYFQSSGTTQIQTFSKHYIADLQIYEQSIYQSFAHFIGKPEEYIFLGLLPGYLERKNASLIYMVNYLMQCSNKPENGYFLYNHQELLQLLKHIPEKKVILFGVSFALLDFLDFCAAQHPQENIQLNENFIIMETGGMKGRKTEITKDELLKALQKGFGTEKVFSEYSMTELLSQAYSLGKNIYQTPNWMRILIRNTEDPFSYVSDGKTGAINIIDLANRHSCSFIATQDLGKIDAKPYSTLLHPAFQVLGRIDHSDIRGCSLLVS